MGRREKGDGNEERGKRVEDGGRGKGGEGEGERGKVRGGGRRGKVRGGEREWVGEVKGDGEGKGERRR